MDTIQYTADEQAANRAKLVTALRSGDYAQGHGMLRQTDVRGGNVLFCCLGVACDISGLGVWDAVDGYVTTEGASSTRHLPSTVKRWLGFSANNGILDHPVDTPAAVGDYAANVLTDANDSGVTFEEIADLIESGEVRTV